MLLAEYEIKSVQKSRQRDMIEVKAVLVHTSPGIGWDEEATFHADGDHADQLPIGATIEVRVRERTAPAAPAPEKTK